MVKAISMTGVLVVKMKDVAELAGVSSAAVSRYLNGGYISTDKAERIKQAIELTGYVRSSQARALRTGSTKLGKRPLNGEEGRWAWEHLVVNDARLKEIGFHGLLQPLNITPQDHEGGGAARIQQWDGSQWVLRTDWIKADHALLDPLIKEGSLAYAKEKGITPRNPETESN